MPDRLPLKTDTSVLASGVIEIAQVGAPIGFPKHRRVSGTVASAFLVAISSGNIAQYRERTDAFGLNADRARLFRLLFQPLPVARVL